MNELAEIGNSLRVEANDESYNAGDDIEIRVCEFRLYISLYRDALSPVLEEKRALRNLESVGPIKIFTKLYFRDGGKFGCNVRIYFYNY